jgi:asparagine synthase (glutamine-hydrolysing)
MCGIAGIFHFDLDRKVNLPILKSMCDIVSHRGPDGEGFYVSKNIGLGHRRLSIIDIDNGQQPMICNDKNLIVTFNGEIYNYIELKEALIKRGHVFISNSDTEVILNAYKEWGINCQEKFNGMWAFAIYDTSKNQLFISRDRVGEKPIHYCQYDNSLIFASEIKSLFKYGVPKEKRLELTELYLTFTNIPEPATFYKNIYKLEAGNCLIIQSDYIKKIKYWDLPYIPESDMNKNKTLVYKTFEETFYDSVKLRMRSDVTFGAFLSGGLDSSSIVAIMSEISDQKVNTFTVGFDDISFDESRLAEEVALRFNTEHYLNTVTPEDFDSLINKIYTHFDEPFGDSSAIPTGYVSKFASEKVKMVLTGDGGDEILSGYNSFLGIKISNLINLFPNILTNTIPIINDAIKTNLTGKLRYKLNKISNIIEIAKLPFPERLVEKTSYTNYGDIKKLTSNIESVIDSKIYMTEFLSTCKYKDDFYKMMYVNFKFGLPNDYLVKVDRMSMAYSLETRLPFLDYRLIEFMAMVDKNVKMQGWERKSILRRTIGKKLPDSLLKLPKKGFGVPIREWFKEESFADKIESNLKNVRHLLDNRTINKIVSENRGGKTDNGNFIWALMLLDKNLN